MQTISQAVQQQAAQPNANQHILNIAKLSDFHGNDIEDPFEWIDSVKVTVRANNWDDAKTLQVVPSALKGSAQQWYQDAMANGAFNAFTANAPGNSNNPFEDAFMAHFASNH